MWLFLASLQQFVCVHAYIPIIKNLIVNSLFLEERLLNIIRRGPAFISSAVRCCQKTCLKTGGRSSDDSRRAKPRWCFGAGNSSRFCPRKCVWIRFACDISMSNRTRAAADRHGFVSRWNTNSQASFEKDRNTCRSKGQINSVSIGCSAVLCNHETFLARHCLNHHLIGICHQVPPASVPSCLELLWNTGYTWGPRTCNHTIGFFSLW